MDAKTLSSCWTSELFLLVLARVVRYRENVVFSEISDFFVEITRKVGRNMSAQVAVIMGSKSDWETMSHACVVLEELRIPYEKKVVSAHRTPDLMFEFAEGAAERGIKVIIAGAGGAAHLPGMVASKTVLPVIGVPVKSAALNGLDSLLSIVQMPGGIPVATVAIGKAGATNAGLLAAQILGAFDPALSEKVQARRDRIKAEVLESGEELEQVKL